jgi:uncharacterized membrane protein YraQ (UPF0718 family)/copper chaperone CopZ
MNIVQLFFKETISLFLEMSPYLLMGFFFAGILHIFFGEYYIKKHFAQSGWWSTIKASLLGVPLPICSCGVIPLAEALQKDGAAKSSTMSFLVSTPSSGVDSILATYALMGPVYAIFRPIASFLSGILVGIVTHFSEKETGKPYIPPNQDKKPILHKNSFKDMMYFGFVTIPADLAKWLIIGVIIGGAISAIIPADFGLKYLTNGFLNYAVILLISIPLYVCATGSIPIAASLLQKGIMPGAALAFLIAGPATNSVTISFMYKRMGKKLTVIYLISIIVISVISGVIFDLFFTVSIISHHHQHTAIVPESLKIISALIMIVLFINAKYPLVSFFRKAKPTGKNTAVITILVPAMSCSQCEQKLISTLNSIPEITHTHIDLKGKTITVTSSLHPDEIIKAINQVGYQASEKN